MSLTNLISEIEIQKYVMRECVKDLGYGSDDIVADIVEEIKKNLPRPEILAFADAMETEMRKHDAENGDSWKEMDVDDLEDGMGEAFEKWWSNYEYGYEQDKDHYLDIATFAMKLWNRTKE